MKISHLLISMCLGISATSCAVLHHVQLSDIDNRSQFMLVPIEVKVSEVGVDLGDAKAIAAGSLAHSRDRQAAGDIATIIQSFQMGPRTGAPVYSDKYAEKLIYQLHTQCPSGKITGVQSVRESREYPVIKGEIVKITGFCLREKGS